MIRDEVDLHSWAWLLSDASTSQWIQKSHHRFYKEKKKKNSLKSTSNVKTSSSMLSRRPRDITCGLFYTDWSWKDTSCCQTEGKHSRRWKILSLLSANCGGSSTSDEHCLPFSQHCGVLSSEMLLIIYSSSERHSETLRRHLKEPLNVFHPRRAQNIRGENVTGSTALENWSDPQARQKTRNLT